MSSADNLQHNTDDIVSVSINRKLDKLDEKLSAISNETSRMEETINNLSSRVMYLEQKIETLDQRILDFSNKLIELETHVSDHKDSLEKFHGEIYGNGKYGLKTQVAAIFATSSAVAVVLSFVLNVAFLFLSKR